MVTCSDVYKKYLLRELDLKQILASLCMQQRCNFKLLIKHWVGIEVV